MKFSIKKVIYVDYSSKFGGSSVDYVRINVAFILKSWIRHMQL